MRPTPLPALGSPPAAYGKLLARLARAQGTVVARTLRRKVGGQWVDKGPYYFWTGKRRGKTVCHALSQAQYEMAKAAIAANRRVTVALGQMQALTLHQILKTIPGVTKRK